MAGAKVILGIAGIQGWLEERSGEIRQKGKLTAGCKGLGHRYNHS